MQSILPDTFRLLSACFYMPEKQIFLEENLCTNLKMLMGRCCPAAEDHCLGMEQGLRESGEEELQAEYAALFVGPFELLAPPYGSVYLDGKHMLMGNSTMEVQQMYRQAGLTLETKEVPDHIALELEFASYLAAGTGQVQQKNSESEIAEIAVLYERFLQHHLGRWVPGFCQRIRTGSKNMFYRSLADCLETFIALQKCNPPVSVSANTA